MRTSRNGLDTALEDSYGDLRALASYLLRRRRDASARRETSLVHEAYLRLASGRRAAFRDREHFLATAARAMRFLLVDDARRRATLKRDGGRDVVPVGDARSPVGGQRSPDLLAVDEALDHLEQVDARRAAVVELRFFGGLSNREIARELGLSLATVKRDWQLARAWLHRRIHDRSG